MKLCASLKPYAQAKAEVHVVHELCERSGSRFDECDHLGQSLSLPEHRVDSAHRCALRAVVLLHRVCSRALPWPGHPPGLACRLGPGIAGPGCCCRRSTCGSSTLPAEAVAWTVRRSSRSRSTSGTSRSRSPLAGCLGPNRRQLQQAAHQLLLPLLQALLPLRAPSLRRSRSPGARLRAAAYCLLTSRGWLRA